MNQTTSATLPLGAGTGTTTAYDGDRRVPSGAPVRLTRRGRALVLVAMVALLFAAFAFGRVSWAGASDLEPAAARAELGHAVVQAGDTLWAVASRLEDGGDVRDMVAQIREINDLDSAELQVGQQLLLPVPS